MHLEQRSAAKLRFSTSCSSIVFPKHLQVRDYFGEKVGFYFLWMTYLNKGLFSASILGGVMWFVDSPLFTGTPNNLFAPVFCFFVILWLVTESARACSYSCPAAP